MKKKLTMQPPSIPPAIVVKHGEQTNLIDFGIHPIPGQPMDFEAVTLAEARVRTEALLAEVTVRTEALHAEVTALAEVTVRTEALHAKATALAERTARIKVRLAEFTADMEVRLAEVTADGDVESGLIFHEHLQDGLMGMIDILSADSGQQMREATQ